MCYYLFLDDKRLPQRVTWVQLPQNVDWLVVRNWNQFTDAFLVKGFPKFVSFDNDLCDEHYEEYFAAKRQNRPYNYEATETKTGYHCAKWMMEACILNKINIPDFIVHSKNDFAQRDIKKLLDSAPKFN